MDLRILLLLLVMTGCTGGTLDPAEGLSRLRDTRGTAVWEETVALAGDFDCDGVTDLAALGREAGSVLVAVARGSGEPPDVLQFAIDRSRQDAICSEPATLALDSLARDPAEDASGPLEGFRPSETCHGLRLSGGPCDDVFIYWNHETRHLDWWRP